MTEYRFYMLNSLNRIDRPPKDFDCVDDAAAIEKAFQMLGGLAMEVWRHDRLVAQLKPKRLDGRHTGVTGRAFLQLHSAPLTAPHGDDEFDEARRDGKLQRLEADDDAGSDLKF